MKNTVIKILNILFTIVSVTTFFLIIVTAGVFVQALDQTLLASAMSAGHKINMLGALYGAIMALFSAVMVGMMLIKGKNVAEKFSVFINVLFLGFLAIYFTVNVSGFIFVFIGLSLAFSILVAMFMTSENKHKKS